MEKLTAKFGSQTAKAIYYVALFNNQLIADKSLKRIKMYCENVIAKVTVSGTAMGSTIEQLEKMYEEAAIDAVIDAKLVKETFPFRYELAN